MSDATSQRGFRWQLLGLWLGPAIALLTYALLGTLDGDGLSHAGRATAAVGILMAIWWLTEALPLPATSLLPLALFPILGVSSIGVAAAPYARDVIFLFMGGFMLGLAMERWGLHKRIALAIILAIGTRPRQLVAGFMVATAVMSMWISNTATAIILLPVAQSVVGLMLRPGSDAPATIEQAKRFAACLVLAIAYSASIGGSGTLIGSPPNLVVSGYVQQTLGCDIGVLTWMSFGIPAVLILLPLTWWYLTHVAFPFDADALPGGREQILREWNALGPMDRGERAVVGVFLFAAVAWMLRPQLAQWLNLPLLSDAGIAMAAAMVLFIIPARKDTPTLDWETALRLPWGILLLFGGGLSLAAAISTHGVDQLIAGSLGGAATLPPIVLLLAVTVLVKFATELSSNTAVATAFTPVLASMALGLGAAPMPILIAIGLSANYAFMMPVATPPNAIAFSSGRVSIGQMARTGLAINLASIPIIALIASIAGSHICQ